MTFNDRACMNLIIDGIHAIALVATLGRSIWGLVHIRLGSRSESFCQGSILR